MIKTLHLFVSCLRTKVSKAGQELNLSEKKVIDIALKYGIQYAGRYGF